MKLLIAGTIGLDTIETPFGKHANVLGGSAVHASVSASFHAEVNMVSIAGEDFPKPHQDFLKSRKINTEGIQLIKGKQTFRWSGYYEYDMNQAHTRDTQLNVLMDFDPRLPEKYTESELVLLGNLDPIIQNKIIDQLKKPALIALDTMNFWIEHKKDELLKTMQRAQVVIINDAEARELMKTPSLVQAAQKILKLGVKRVIIKKGEHGAVMFDKKTHFSAASYPLETVIDPTGAGDSFAGGLMGYLASTEDFSEKNFRKAVIVGSVMASFNVEDFSLNRMRKLKPKEIVKRYNEFREFSEFDAI